MGEGRRSERRDRGQSEPVRRRKRRRRERGRRRPAGYRPGTPPKHLRARPLSIVGVRVWRIRAGVDGSDLDGPLDLLEPRSSCPWTHAAGAHVRAPTCTMRIRPHTGVCMCVLICVCIVCARYTDVQRATNRPEHTHTREIGGWARIGIGVGEFIQRRYYRRFYF